MNHRRFSGFGVSSADVELVQRWLIMIGWPVSLLTGTYDAATRSAIREFRGATGLPYNDLIDDELMARLGDEADLTGDVSRLPDSPGGGPVRRTDDIGIFGSVAGLGIGALLLLVLLKKKKRRK